METPQRRHLSGDTSAETPQRRHPGVTYVPPTVTRTRASPAVIARCRGCPISWLGAGARCRGKEAAPGRDVSVTRCDTYASPA
eukprot:1407661-Pyramimonas_sp.AAC.1